MNNMDNKNDSKSSIISKMKEEMPEIYPEASAIHMPVIRAPEKTEHIFMITLYAATLPLLGGIIFFGWRAAFVAALSMVSCVFFEKIYYRIVKSPSLGKNAHALLTGLLLALTLPAYTPWYVVVMGAGIAIIIGKAIFGGVGHFLWQPAIVGRFAIAVIMPFLHAPPSDASLQPDMWPVLDKNHLLTGDIDKTEPLAEPLDYNNWEHQDSKLGNHGFRVSHPADTIAGLTRDTGMNFSGIAEIKNNSLQIQKIEKQSPALMRHLPRIWDLIIGSRPGGIGETSVFLILVATLYLVYRKYVKWQLPLVFILFAVITAAIAPIKLTGPHGNETWHYYPLFLDEFYPNNYLSVGFTYICYQLLSGQIILAACFMATEMTSRPITTSGQVIFGAGCGILAMIFKLYMPTPIPAYFAVLCMNTFTPTIDMLWQPRVFGQKRFVWFSKE